ncbi:hypothetical protein CRUP_033511 [Coryphaenoides rupestris]|nr:hypothetical protein CRUP_033511 [Coryphaenoides rupestris]
MAVMNPQFMSFCFPGGGGGGGGGGAVQTGDYSPDPGSLHAELDLHHQHHQHHQHQHQDLHHQQHQHHHHHQHHQHPHEEEGEEGGGYRETTRDLLSFIDSASSNIKLALDKPVKSKRKVNHRKYLQKQIKRCTGIMGHPDACSPPPPTPPPPPPPPAAPQTQGSSPPPPPAAVGGGGGGGKMAAPLPRRSDGVQASLQSKSLAALFNPGKEARGGGGGAGGGGGGMGSGEGSGGGKASRRPPLRHRNLPLSFFTEPAHRCHGNGNGAGVAGVCATPGVTLGELERGGDPDAADFFELLGPDYGGDMSPAVGAGTGPAGVVVGAGHGDLSGSSFDPQNGMLGAGLVYAEPWGGCTATGFRKGGGGGGGEGEGGGGGGGGGGGVGQLPLYGLGDGVDDSGLCGLMFPGFFSDSAGGGGPYDLGSPGCYGRAHYSSL